jgi:hypothetical protein
LSKSNNFNKSVTGCRDIFFRDIFPDGRQRLLISAVAEAGPDRYMYPDRVDDDCGRGCRAPDRILNKEQWPDRARPLARLRRDMAGLPYDGPGCILSNTDREQELQHPSQAERHLAQGAEHIKWQREVIAILERISLSAEAIEGARALLTTLLQTQAQREQDRDPIRASLDCDLDLSSTIPLAQPVGHQNEAAGVGGVAGPHLCADRTPVQLEAKKLENLGEGRPSETASFDAVSQDEAADNGITHFMPFGNAAAIEPKGSSIVLDGSSVSARTWLTRLARIDTRACLHSPCPEDGGDEVDDGGEAFVGLLVARGNASKGFYAAEKVFGW